MSDRYTAAAEARAAEAKDHTTIIESLQAERAGYVSRGLSTRVADVDAQLSEYGALVTETAPAAESQQTADAETPPADVVEVKETPPADSGRRGSARAKVPAQTPAADEQPAAAE